MTRFAFGAKCGFAGASGLAAERSADSFARQQAPQRKSTNASSRLLKKVPSCLQLQSFEFWIHGLHFFKVAVTLRRDESPTGLSSKH